MPKQMIEVDVPERMQVDAAYPVVRVLEGNELRMTPHTDTTLYAVTFRPAWQWPKEWLFRWAAKDSYGTISGHNNKPCLRTGYWTYKGSAVAIFSPGSTTFDIPGAWQDSLRENPNYQGKE